MRNEPQPLFAMAAYSDAYSSMQFASSTTTRTEDTVLILFHLQSLVNYQLGFNHITTRLL